MKTLLIADRTMHVDDVGPQMSKIFSWYPQCRAVKDEDPRSGARPLAHQAQCVVLSVVRRYDYVKTTQLSPKIVSEIRKNGHPARTTHSIEGSKLGSRASLSEMISGVRGQSNENWGSFQ